MVGVVFEEGCCDMFRRAGGFVPKQPFRFRSNWLLPGSCTSGFARLFCIVQELRLDAVDVCVCGFEAIRRQGHGDCGSDKECKTQRRWRVEDWIWIAAGESQIYEMQIRLNRDQVEASQRKAAVNSQSVLLVASFDPEPVRSCDSATQTD